MVHRNFKSKQTDEEEKDPILFNLPDFPSKVKVGYLHIYLLHWRSAQSDWRCLFADQGSSQWSKSKGRQLVATEQSSYISIYVSSIHISANISIYLHISMYASPPLEAMSGQSLKADDSWLSLTRHSSVCHWHPLIIILLATVLLSPLMNFFWSFFVW